MLHTEVLHTYKKMFVLDNMIDVWHANGYNSIRVRFRDKKEIVFTYHSDSKWKLETIDEFLDNLNKNKKEKKI